MLLINDLPNEVLLSIFKAGSEVSYWEYKTLRRRTYDPARRRLATFERHIEGQRTRKPFAGLARSICSRWQAIVDHPLNIHFWVMNISLQLRAGEGRFVSKISKFLEC